VGVNDVSPGLAIALRLSQHLLLLSRNLELLDSGGSTVARLKLKGIDGKPPPGVECVA